MLEHCVLVPGTMENLRAHQLRVRMEKAQTKPSPKTATPAVKNKTSSAKKAK